MLGGSINFLILLYTPAKWGFELTKPAAATWLLICNLGSLFHDTLGDDGLENAIARLWVVAIVAGDIGTECINDTAGVGITAGRDDSELCTTVEVFDCFEPTNVTGVWGRAIACNKVKLKVDDDGIKGVVDWLWIVAPTGLAEPTNVTGFEGSTIGDPDELVGIVTGFKGSTIGDTNELVGILTGFKGSTIGESDELDGLLFGWNDKECKGIEETLSITGKCELEFNVVFITALFLLTSAETGNLAAFLMLLWWFEVDTRTCGVWSGTFLCPMCPIVSTFLSNIFIIFNTDGWVGWRLFVGIEDIDMVLTELWAVELSGIGDKDDGWRICTVVGCNCGTFEILEDGIATSLLSP